MALFEGSAKYFWTAFWVILVFFFGFIVLLVSGAGKQINIGSALIWATACFCSGCLLGFIFGVPKIISNLTTSPGGGALSDSQQKAAIQENNNLTDISDWLTKVLVGAGLVELKTIPSFILKIATRMGNGLALQPALVESATILSAGILLYYLSFGFMAGYLTMRLVIFDILSPNSDRDQNRSLNGG
jgi:hypothetical protein